MKLYQLAHDEAEYGEIAGHWLVVSDDMNDEIAGPFATEQDAQDALNLKQQIENWMKD